MESTTIGDQHHISWDGSIDVQLKVTENIMHLTLASQKKDLPSKKETSTSEKETSTIQDAISLVLKKISAIETETDMVHKKAFPNAQNGTPICPPGETPTVLEQTLPPTLASLREAIDLHDSLEGTLNTYKTLFASRKQDDARRAAHRAAITTEVVKKSLDTYYRKKDSPLGKDTPAIEKIVPTAKEHVSTVPEKISKSLPAVSNALEKTVAPQKKTPTVDLQKLSPTPVWLKELLDLHDIIEGVLSSMKETEKMPAIEKEAADAKEKLSTLIEEVRAAVKELSSVQGQIYDGRMNPAHIKTSTLNQMTALFNKAIMAHTAIEPLLDGSIAFTNAPSDDMARSGFLEECQGLHERVVRGLGNFKKVPATYKNNLADLKGVKTS